MCEDRAEMPYLRYSRETTGAAIAETAGRITGWGICPFLQFTEVIGDDPNLGLSVSGTYIWIINYSLPT